MKETNHNGDNEMNIFHNILNGTITSDDILFYTGSSVSGYANAPASFHAVDFHMQQVSIIFFDGTTAKVHHSELEVR